MSSTPAQIPGFADHIQHFRLKSAGGLEVDVTNFGAIITAIRAADRQGNTANVALGFGTLAEFLNLPALPYLGAVVGRFGNRIRGGKFTLDGVEHELATNDGPNHLHGGTRGFDAKVWTAEPVEGGVQLTYVSPDGDNQYPGELRAQVTYRMGPENDLHLLYEARASAPTIVNLTNHTYFNLKGAGEGDILDHELTLEADEFTPIDATMIPTGEIRPVEGTPYDFRAGKRIGEHMGAEDEQLANAGGYDHNFVLRRGDAVPGELALCATVREPASGRVLRVLTTEPGVQFYSGNFLEGNFGLPGKPFVHRGGFCLETQHYPDSPNQPGFPSVVLRPGEVYRSETVFAFSVEQ